jgi:hypothetical protein
MQWAHGNMMLPIQCGQMRRNVTETVGDRAYSWLIEKTSELSLFVSKKIHFYTLETTITCVTE